MLIPIYRRNGSALLSGGKGREFESRCDRIFLPLRTLSVSEGCAEKIQLER